jgi:glycosyltransferase involved in cell wall biosynthesis
VGLISIIVPCYNEEAVLPALFDRLGAAAASWGTEFEVICVNDGSRDRTWELLTAQHRKDPRWKGLSFARNFGHQTAVSVGLHHSSGDAVVIIDADLQDPPESISKLIAKWREGFEVVYAVRTQRRDPLLKTILAWGFYRVIGAMVPFRIPRDSGDYALLDRVVVDVMNSLPERNRYLRGLRAWVGFKQCGVEFERHARAAGTPQYTFKKSFRLAMDGLFSFSTVPLRLATYLGLCVSALAFIGVFFTLIQKLFSRQFEAIGLAPGPGFPTIVVSVLFLGGIQLICLGILGEYLGRIYDEVKGRPHWILRECLGLNPLHKSPLQDFKPAQPAPAERFK